MSDEKETKPEGASEQITIRVRDQVREFLHAFIVMFVTSSSCVTVRSAFVCKDLGH